MKKEISVNELNERIQLNFNRLENDPYYQIENVFSPMSYDWYGDKEGRAILAFVSHYKISGKIIPCLPLMIKQLPEKLNSEGYFGTVYNGETIHEQQLSGHSWFLRGLCEYYMAFSDSYALSLIKSVSEKLFLPICDRVKTYPVIRENKGDGDVSGNSSCKINGWELSTDIGCAFMSIDGLSHAFEVTGDDRIKALTDEMIAVYMGIDKVKLKVQTHCTLTAARGMLRMYKITGEEKYLSHAKEIYNLYVFGGGVTYTYHNLNWWGRPDTWTEPCAIVDSLMVALELYKITSDEEYRTFASRVYHNAFASMQRSNGGAGTDTVICENSPWNFLGIQMYEAYFCCTMRLSEGLWYISENRALLYANYSGEVSKNEKGMYVDGDIIYCEIDEEFYGFADEIKKCDGLILCPIIKNWRVPKDIDTQIQMKIIF